MSKTYQIKTNAAKGESQLIQVAPAPGKAPASLKAVAGARYELIDSATQAAPDNIRIMRKGKSLQIFFDGNTEAGAVVEDFYTAHADEQPTLVGRTEAGKFFEYIPESAAPSSVVSQLGDTGNTYGMALGGVELAAGAAPAIGVLAPIVAGFSPLLLGAGALGAAALAGGGGGGGAGGGSPAPLATAKLADASDSGTKGDNKTSDSTPTLSGNVPTGSTATVTVTSKDANGQSISKGPYPVTVNADGTYSYTIPNTDKLPDGTYTPVINVTKNGSSTSYDGTPFVIDTVTTVKIADSGLAGTTKAINGTSEPGNTIEVSDVTGKLIGTTKADSSGNWSLTPTQSLAAGNITAKATDTAGNTATDTDSNLINGGQALKLNIEMDANNDGVINLVEKGSASANTTTIKVSFDSNKVTAGDIITLREGSTEKTITLTAANVADGKILINWNLPTTEGALLKVTAIIKDANSTLNNVTPEASDSATVDVTAPVNKDLGLALKITTDDDDNGWINFSELGSATKITSQATFVKSMVKAGDSLLFTATNGTSLLDSISHKLTDTDIDKGYVNVGFDKPLTEGVTQTVNVTYLDAAGNDAKDKVTDSATMDTQAPSNAGIKLDLKITADSPSTGKPGGDGWINASELARDPNGPSYFTSRAIFDKAQVAEGESILFGANNSTIPLASKLMKLTATDISNGYVDVYFDKPGSYETQTVTAQYMDKAGNTANDVVRDSATLDTTVPTTLSLTIDLDNGLGNTNPDKNFKDDGYINSYEKGSAGTTSITARFLTSEVAAGDKITFSNGIKEYDHTVVLTALDVANGYVTSNGKDNNGWALPPDQATLNATASFIDISGNTASASDAAKMDTSLVNFNALGSVATGGTLQQLSFTKPGEAGTYKLHIDNSRTGINDAPKNYEINGSIDSLGNQKNTNWPASGTSITAKGTDIYLEFWDNAGNYSGKVGLPSSISDNVAFTDKTNFNFNFIV